MKSSNIGGQAVLEGIMMKNETRYAVAVRKPDQQIEVCVKEYKGIIPWQGVYKVPFIRGIFNFIDSLVLGMKTLTYSASFFEEEEGEVLTEQEAQKQEKQEKQSEAGSALQTGEDANDDANRAEESQTVKEKDAADGPDNTQQPQMASISAITTQVLPPSFIPTATGRIRPVTGAFPAVQSASQTEQAQRRRSIRSLAAGSLRRTNIGNAEKAGDAGSAGSTGRTAGNGDTPSPRIASSAPHYAN